MENNNFHQICKFPGSFEAEEEVKRASRALDGLRRRAIRQEFRRRRQGSAQRVRHLLHVPSLLGLVRPAGGEEKKKPFSSANFDVRI